MVFIGKRAFVSLLLWFGRATHEAGQSRWCSGSGGGVSVVVVVVVAADLGSRYFARKFCARARYMVD